MMGYVRAAGRFSRVSGAPPCLCSLALLRGVCLLCALMACGARGGVARAVCECARVARISISIT